MGHANAIQACAWAPWAFLVLDREKDAPPLLSILQLAFCICFMILTRAQYGFYTILALGFHAVWNDLKIPRRPRSVVILLSATLLAFSIASVQVLPTLEFVMHSDRSAGVEYQAQLLGAVSWSQILWLILPVWLQSHTQGVAAESISYVGITTVFLMLASLAKIRTPKYVPWVLLLFASLLLSMGNDFPLNAFIYRIPGFSFFRGHARWLFITSLSAAVLAGWGAEFLLHAAKDRLRPSLPGLMLVLLVFFDLSYCLRPLVHFLDRSVQESAPDALAILSGGGRYFVHDTPTVFLTEKEAERHPTELLRRYFSASEPFNANLGMRYGLSSVQVYAGLYPRWSCLLFQPTLEDLSGMSCRYLVSRQTIQGDRLREVWRNPFFRIYVNDSSEPRARLVSSIDSDGNDGYSARRKMEGSAEILRQPREDRVFITVHSEKEGFLILADTFYPGWKAIVNGREETISRVNGWMRAVPVPAGACKVVFLYRPASFTWGIVLSGAGLFLSVLILFLGRNSKSCTIMQVRRSDLPC